MSRTAMSTVTLSLAQTRDLIKAAFIASRTGEANAISVADALAAAEALGQTGHGLRRVAAYCAQARSGKVDGFARPSAEQTAPSVILIDAANGFAYPAIDKAMQLLPPLAHQQGIALAGIRRSHHCGVMGLVVERLADAGLVALMVANPPAARHSLYLCQRCRVKKGSVSTFKSSPELPPLTVCRAD